MTGIRKCDILTNKESFCQLEENITDLIGVVGFRGTLRQMCSSQADHDSRENNTFYGLKKPRKLYFND